jgi:hypothetical protein
MLIELPSGYEDKLTLSSLEKLDDESYKCQLDLSSGSFTAKIEFWLDTVSARQVLDVLSHIIDQSRGTARLSFRYEEPFIEFKGDGLGHIAVSGLLTEGPPFQRLEFVFQTDQTMVGSFIKNLENLLNEP